MKTFTTKKSAKTEMWKFMRELHRDGVDLREFIEECDRCANCATKFFGPFGTGSGQDGCCSDECHDDWMADLERCYDEQAEADEFERVRQTSFNKL